MTPDFYKLILVTNRKNTSLDEYLKFIKICATSGITAVQLREKNANCEFLLDFGRKLKSILAPLNLPLIINDHVQLTVELDADGVHLGPEDGDPKLARKILGPHKIIGVSVYSQKDLIAANALPINYIGVGAVFNTMSKENIDTILGVTKLKKILAKTNHPAVGIGGINENNASSVIKAGAQGIAVINAIHSARDPAKTIGKLRAIIDKDEVNNYAS